MEWFLGLVVLVLGYLYWGKKRGDAFVREVGTHVAHSLKAQGESRETIAAFLFSPFFSVLSKSSFGQKSAYEVVEIAELEFTEKADRYRELAQHHVGQRWLANLPDGI
jgi:hypothetical protein